MGNALRRTGADLGDVAEAYRGAIRFDPGHQDARANLAAALLDLGRPDEARAVVDELSQLNPANPAIDGLRGRLSAAQASSPPISSELQQGIALYAAEDYAGAIAHLESAILSGAAPARMQKTVLMMLARSLEATGNREQAAKWRQQAEALGASP